MESPDPIHLDALDPEAQGGRRADGLSPLHVPRLSHSPLRFLLLGRGLRVHLDHLLVHVFPEAGLLPGLGELLLQVGPVDVKACEAEAMLGGARGIGGWFLMGEYRGTFAG